MSSIPNFLIVGAAKSGTTSLCRYLTQNKEVFITEPKEPHFFVVEKPYGKTVRTWEEYCALFVKGAGKRARGEASTGYLYHWREASQRIRDLVPGCKIVVILRNPVERIYSMYWHNVRDGREPLSFDAALAAEPERIRHMWELSYHYRKLALSADAVEGYINTFGRDSVKIIFFDDLKKRPQCVMSELFAFLNVPDVTVEVRRRYNRSGQPRFPILNRWLATPTVGKSLVMTVMPDGVRKRMSAGLKGLTMRSVPKIDQSVQRLLAEYFNEDIDRLALLTGRNLESWRMPGAS